MVLINSKTTYIVVILSVFWVQMAYSNAVPEDEGVTVSRLRTGRQNRLRRTTTTSNNDHHTERKLPEAELYNYWKMIPNEESIMSMTNAPTQKPSQKPTDASTAPPTDLLPLSADAPTAQPSVAPTDPPTLRPTAGPTSSPTLPPNEFPTLSPTKSPTAEPSKIPSSSPSSIPSRRPTPAPSASPSILPSARPSGFPTGTPSDAPSLVPSSAPSARPSGVPTSAPTRSPTARPTTSEPTILPSAGPSSSMAPTSKRKKAKRVDLFYSGALAGFFPSPDQSGGDDQQLPDEVNAATAGRAFGIPDTALRLPEFEDNGVALDQEQFGTVDSRLPLSSADP